MNLLQGGELWSLLYQSRSLPRSETGGLKEKIARFYAAQVACAIAHIHERGYMYRDLKPENFLIGVGKKSDTLYVIDFGLAKRYICPKTGKHVSLTRRMNPTGTMRYCSA